MLSLLRLGFIRVDECFHLGLDVLDLLLDGGVVLVQLGVLLPGSVELFG